MRSYLIAGTVVTFAAPAAALAQAPCTLPYEAFEFAVPHIDLDTCPASVEGEAGFCRVTLASDQLHVFVFDEEGEQCLRSVTSFDEGEGFEIRLN